MKLKKTICAFSCLPLLFGIGCNNNSGLSTDNHSTGARIQLIPAISTTAPSGLKRVAPSRDAGLESFQVAVADISIAKDLNTNGSGWSGISGAFSLFSQNLGDFNQIDSTTVRSQGFSSKFIDFCNSQSISRISTSKPFTIRDTGSYHWAVINWAPFFKVKAVIPFENGDTVYTHDGFIEHHLYTNTTDGRYYITRSQKSLLEGPAEHAFVRKNNGGTWFRFLKPLKLTAADLDTGTTIPDTIGTDSTGKPIIQHLPSGKWNVMLVFNPQDLVYAGINDTSNYSINGDIVTQDSSMYVHVPFLKATAVPYREGESVMRETYEFIVPIDKAWAKGNYGMRLELYLIGDNVVAATVNSYPLDGTLAPPEVPVIFFAEDNGDGSINLQNYDRTPVFDKFVRKATVGEIGSVAWDASSMSQDQQSLSYKLTEIKKMN